MFCNKDRFFFSRAMPSHRKEKEKNAGRLGLMHGHSSKVVNAGARKKAKDARLFIKTLQQRAFESSRRNTAHHTRVLSEDDTVPHEDLEGLSPAEYIAEGLDVQDELAKGHFDVDFCWFPVGLENLAELLTHNVSLSNHNQTRTIPDELCTQLVSGPISLWARVTPEQKDLMCKSMSSYGVIVQPGLTGSLVVLRR
jgi:hypothetical protein